MGGKEGKILSMKKVSSGKVERFEAMKLGISPRSSKIKKRNENEKIMKTFGKKIENFKSLLEGASHPGEIE